MADVTIDIGTMPLSVGTSAIAGAYVYGVPLNPANNRTWSGVWDNYRGAIKVGITIGGAPLGHSIPETLFPLTTQLGATTLIGQVIDASNTLTTQLGAEWYSSQPRPNWVGWSRIGELNFEPGRNNEAGFRPMDWQGTVWQVKKLDEVVIVYGSGGVTMMTPVIEPVPSFGFKDILTIGIKSVYSIAGDDNVHYFITKTNELWRLTKKGLEKLGFSEYLTNANLVLNYDSTNQRLFISDGIIGYVYKSGLGGGYAALTGITQNYAIAPTLNQLPMTGIPFLLITNILDLGHRGIKTITFIEVGINTTQPVYVSLDFRYDKAEDWRASPWIRTSPEGVARVGIAAVEFRVRVKQTVYEEIRIDYLNIRHTRSDKRFIRGPMFDTAKLGEGT